MLRNDHLDNCGAWIDPYGDPKVLCGCPPPWRIRKNQADGDRYPWHIQRLLRDGTYELFMRATDFEKAIAMVSSITELTYRPTR